MMTWHQRYQLQHFFRTSFWFFPVCGVVAALVLLPLMRWLDEETGWIWFNFTADGAKAVLGGLNASMLTFMVFVLSSMLLVVQLASAQMTPRVIAIAFSAPIPKLCAAVFTFSYVFSLGVLGRMDARVDQLGVALSVMGTVASLCLFFWFVHSLARSLRPIAMMQAVCEAGRTVAQSVYPRPFESAQKAERIGLPTPARMVTHDSSSGTFLAFGTAVLVKLARRANCTIELVPQVGDFVAKGEPLFRIHPENAPIDEHRLRAAVAIGGERTLEQDPCFAFRIMVDIAIRALSPAINDPTTAVSALDQIHRLLRYIGGRQLDNGVVTDKDGKVRLLYPTPDWEDIVCLATSEIRLFGVSSLQVARRLRAMLEHLIAILPPPRIPALRQEMELVQAAVERSYSDAADRRLAGLGDLQGVGGQERQKVVSFKSE
jgi:uncharacterized membrane protein